jgi:hypothetical protein
LIDLEDGFSFSESALNGLTNEETGRPSRTWLDLGGAYTAANPTYVPTDPGPTRGYLRPRTQLTGREGTLATEPGDTPERLDRKPQEATEYAHIVG